VSFAAITLCVASQRVFIVAVIYLFMQMRYLFIRNNLIREMRKRYKILARNPKLKEDLEDRGIDKGTVLKKFLKK
jgi:hypothetical protein